MPKLKDYQKTQAAKLPEPQKPTPTGVACTEIRCKGQMMWREPRETHPELPELDRADCKKCGWLGWV